MIHSGSRGLGHQVATDALTSMEKAMARDKIAVNDRQLACAHISSQEGQASILVVNRTNLATGLSRMYFPSLGVEEAHSCKLSDRPTCHCQYVLSPEA